ncbi:MAG: hypothetical protein COW18_02980 [Zetaproteobacteria bacterium CG12_big_fil_rev_8_21_14_0_65_54_13]|nr:MAG: hypothetical protein COX55_05795 [Zetaproteobacteria bacterium CG23_combo_of_CG06-09_8_20_14_all_54_7]PIW50753.1 MAG: hypothetical protein COW18_02980 [Zetaproteobacteria bacterium CG12_big_fil_rev_8_21_14_0_65_54_13]PIX54200.1 MAG: hypothetical protein COZ50_09165 [Zetaproteobacteria bacterium CG_4_10_14_3_um_filter_54_28]PJA29071.1 MAG: hypothetical protein CO188_07515 [Zetaproteobacteria bacterium CG_4_9_14_3_um_filter_54_145]
MCETVAVGTTNITTTCDVPNTPVTVQMGIGLTGSITNRIMRAGTGVINYSLYTTMEPIQMYGRYGPLF